MPLSIRYLAVLILGAGALWAGVHSLGWPIYHDNVIFQYIAWRMQHDGLVPYREMLDINMPGVYVMHLLALALFGESDFGFRLFDLSILALTSLGLAAYVWRTSPLGALMAVGYYACFHLGMGVWHAGQRDYQMGVFLIWGLYCFTRYLEKPEQFVSTLVAGLLLGFACWVKPITVLLAALLGAVLLFGPLDRHQKWIGLLWFGVGGLIPAVLMLGWLEQLGALPDFVEMLTRLLPAYSNSSHSVTRWMHPGLGTAMLLAYLVGLVCAVVLTFRELGRGVPFWRGILACCGMFYGFAHFYFQFKGLPYHRYPLVLFFALWFGLCLPQVRFSIGRVYQFFQLTVIVLCVAISPLLRRPSPVENMPVYAERAQKLVDEAYAQVPPFIRETSEPSLMFMDFTGALLWNVAYRQHWIPVSRHVHYFALMDHWGGEYAQTLRRELYEDLTQKKPWVILYPNAPGERPIETTQVFDFIEGSDWRTWFATHYRLSASGSRFNVFVRIQ